MSFFSKYPLLNYTVGDVTKPIVDITKRAAILSKFKQESSSFITYTIQDGERPEDVSMKFYKTPKYHWVIMAYNNIIDPYYDWPMSSTQIDRYLSAKFAAENINPFSIKQYETEDGIVLADESNILENYIQLSGAVLIPDELGNIIVQGEGTVFRTELQVGDFVRINNEFGNVLSIQSDTQFTLDRPFTLAESNFGSAIFKQIANVGIPITFYDFEVRNNDRKREIFIPSSDIVRRIDTEYTRALAE